MLSQEPPPQRKDELEPARATVGTPPQHGPGSPGAASRPEGMLTICIQFEPLGPPSTLDVTKETTLGEIKERALLHYGFAPAAIREGIIARNGWQLDEEKTVEESGLNDYDFVMVGRRGEVYIVDPKWGRG